MLQFGHLYYIDKQIYMYRQTENSLWNSVNNIEKDLLNALDYKLICDSAPMFTNEVAKRQYGSIKRLYRNRKNIKKQLENKLQKYLVITSKSRDEFIENLINWGDLNCYKKLKTQIYWLKIKAQSKILR